MKLHPTLLACSKDKEWVGWATPWVDGLLGEGHSQQRHNMGLQCWMDEMHWWVVSLSLPATSKPCLNIRCAWILTSVSLIWWVPLEIWQTLYRSRKLIIRENIYGCVGVKLKEKQGKSCALKQECLNSLLPALASGQQNLWQKCCLVAEGNKSPVVECLKEMNWHQLPLWWRNLQHNQQYLVLSSLFFIAKILPKRKFKYLNFQKNCFRRFSIARREKNKK